MRKTNRESNHSNAKEHLGFFCRFVDLTAAYDSDTVASHASCLRLLPDKHMVRMIMGFVQNRNFTLTTGDSKQSRLRCLKSNAGYAVSQGSVLTPLLFNIYTYDLPFTISRKFTYADDLTLFYCSGNWKAFEGTLNQDMFTHLVYLQIWKLNFSHTMMVTAAFHLTKRTKVS